MTLPLSPSRLSNHDESMPGAIYDNLGAILDRASALAAMIHRTDPATDEILLDPPVDRVGSHPINKTAFALWLEIQDAKAYLRAHEAAFRARKAKEAP
jgi:hypothetical protein